MADALMSFCAPVYSFAAHFAFNGIDLNRRHGSDSLYTASMESDSPMTQDVKWLVRQV